MCLFFWTHESQTELKKPAGKRATRNQSQLHSFGFKRTTYCRPTPHWHLSRLVSLKHWWHIRGKLLPSSQPIRRAAGLHERHSDDVTEQVPRLTLFLFVFLVQAHANEHFNIFTCCDSASFTTSGLWWRRVKKYQYKSLQDNTLKTHRFFTKIKIMNFKPVSIT